MKIAEYNEMMAYLLRPQPKQMLSDGGRIPFDKGGDFSIALENLIKNKDINFNTIQQIFDKTNTPRTGVFEKVFKKYRDQFKIKKTALSATQFVARQNIYGTDGLRKLLGPASRELPAYKVFTQALKNAGIDFTPSTGEGVPAKFENVNNETIKKFETEVSKLKVKAGLPMSRVETENIKKQIKIFVKDKIAKGEYVSRPTIKQQLGIEGKAVDALITRSLGINEKAGTGLLKKLGKEEKAEIARKTGRKAALAKLGESDEVLRVINDEFKFDPDISDSEELAKKIYGDQFTKANKQGQLDLIIQTDNDVFKYLRLLRGSRGRIPKGLRLPSQEKINDLIDHIETGLEDEATTERGKFRRKGFRFSPGLIRDYKLSLVDEKLGLGLNTFKTERSKFVTKGKNLDEVFGLSSSSKYAPGYAEAVQLISPRVNRAKETQIDLPMSRILKTLDEGRTKMTYKGEKNVPIDKVVNDFNRTSAAFANKNNIRGPKINLGGSFNLKNYINFRPESQKNIEQVFKDKNYFLSEVNNKPFETVTQKTKLLNLKRSPDITTADKIPIPEKSRTRKMFEDFSERYRTSKPVIQKFASKVPGSAAVLAPYDLSMMLASGAPLVDALASAGSYFTKDPLIGKAVNIPLAIREMTSYGDVDEMLQRAAARREGIESMLQSIPSRFRSYIDENRGIDDETEEFVP